MKVYIVVAKFKGGLDAIRSVLGVYDDLRLAEAAASQFRCGDHFQLEAAVLEKDLVEYGSPDSNRIMLGG